MASFSIAFDKDHAKLNISPFDAGCLLDVMWSNGIPSIILIDENAPDYNDDEMRGGS